jgi:ABC-type sugar transport system ATPase subunit
VWAGFRPHLAEVTEGSQQAGLRGVLERVEYLGAYQNLYIRIAGKDLVMLQRPATATLTKTIGDEIGLCVAPEHMMVFNGSDEVDEDE